MAVQQTAFNVAEPPQQTSLSLALSPQGHLYLYQGDDGQELMPAAVARKIQGLLKSASDIGISPTGVLRFAISSFNTALPPSFLFWQKFGHLFIEQVRRASALSENVLTAELNIPTPMQDFARLLEEAPFMRGGEYLTQVVLKDLWSDLKDALTAELIPFAGKLSEYLGQYNPTWNTVGRVCFHLAENKGNPSKPFAFLATYTVRVTPQSPVQHVPLGRALKDYAGPEQKSHLLTLLVPVQKAAQQSSLVAKLVQSKSIFQPLAWRASEAHAFLKAIPLIEASGVMVKVPNWWKPQQPPRPKVDIAIGNAQSSAIGLKAMLDFNVSYSLPDGQSLTRQEMEELLTSKDSMVQIKGQWVEVDSQKISQVLSHWRHVEDQVRSEGLSFSDGLRMLAAAPGATGSGDVQETVQQWSKVREGKWIHEILDRLRDPHQQADQNLQTVLAKYLQAELRPYQVQGVQWLWWLYNLNLGGCLADDMGLGKTIQVLSLLLLAKYHKGQSARKPHLLVLPASLLGNWQQEILRFAPNLSVWVAHSSASSAQSLKREDVPDLSQIDLVMTTYGNVHRLPWLAKVEWGVLILDEAQSIKNPSTKQTQAVKAVKSQVRFILTGTPIENRLLDLWSLFDFVAPGLLGSSKIFSNYGKKMKQQHGDESGAGRFYAAVRQLISPYLLRRLKSDKSIIADLPDKTEVDAFCYLSKQQARLYQEAVLELEHKLKHNVFDDQIQRRGIVLSYLTRLKQICNHPTQWLGHGEYEASASGKFIRLKELCASIAAKQEKVLVFTQYREIIPAIHAVLEEVFAQSGLVLHGQTPVKNRPKLVADFQSEQGPPFFVLSLKAGGAGLNLTRASHVIHFDRWWNPAVENQATDRAYRIGQHKNVLVHKFVCQGTIEENIEGLIHSKKQLAEDLLAKGGESSLTEMSNEELLNVVALDIHRAVGER